MPSEAEKRLHRCCLAGHRPEKLDISEEEVQAWLRKQIDAAIGDGYRTFLCGVEPGTDIIAAQIIREKKEKDPELHLICAVPWPDYEEDWNFIWQVQYRFLLEQADIVKYFAKAKTEDAGIFRKRREWMLDHCRRLIAYCNGTPGGTWTTIENAVDRNCARLILVRFCDKFNTEHTTCFNYTFSFTNLSLLDFVIKIRCIIK